MEIPNPGLCPELYVCIYIQLPEEIAQGQCKFSMSKTGFIFLPTSLLFAIVVSLLEHGITSNFSTLETWETSWTSPSFFTCSGLSSPLELAF